MKLFTKIFLQVTCVILILSSAIFFYTTCRWKDQSLQDINSYEWNKFQTSISQFENQLRIAGSQSDASDPGLQEKILVYSFRHVFHDSAALYCDGKELYNGTSYEFEAETIRKLTAETLPQKNLSAFYDYDPVISKTDGKTLLLYSYSSTEYTGEENYQIVTYKDITDVLKRSQILFFQAGALTLGLLLFTGFLLFFSLKKIMAPLTKLNEAALCIADGNYDIQVPQNGNTELAQVGKSFNQMTAKIKEQIESLSAVNQAQRQLLGSLAHELKTPMTAIIGYADTLLTVRLSKERQERALTYIGNECRRLSRLSVKMLELTGLYETGESQLTLQEVPVADFLDEARKLTLYRLQEKNLHLEISCNPENLKKTFDKDLMLSVVTNFIDNAVKASEENSRILLHATNDRLTVQDFGKGIPPEDLSKVTDAFYMVDKSRSRANGSVGLGLSLCQKIADLHGYQMKIESTVGEGTKVSVLW